MAGKNVITLTKENFEQEVINSDKPILVDFWATWCGPCRMIAPVIDELAEEYEGKVKVAKVDVDKESDLAATFKVMSIPTVILFKDGQIVDTSMGARPKQYFDDLLNNNL
jgi:thioredoxin 1